MKTQAVISCLSILVLWNFGSATGNINKKARKAEVLEMFTHAYGSYMNHAYPADELMPLSCKGRVRGREPNRGDVDDALGNFSLTLIDTLDTLAVLGMLDEFEEAVRKVIRDVRFDADLVVSVFETNIRVLGGLLGGHTAAKDLQEQYGVMGWYQDELLVMAKEVGYRLLPAFNTSTGVPYPKVNLKHGLGKDRSEKDTCTACAGTMLLEFSALSRLMCRVNLKHGLGNGRPEKDTCTACAGTMLLEFSALSRLSGDPIFEEKAKSVMQTIWSKRQRTSNLVGTVINIHTGDWVRRESGVGAGIDSYYEYLLKGYILLGDDSYLDRFNTHYEAIQRYISDGPNLMDVQMHRPHARSRNFMDALLAFWPGLQVLFGDIEPAIETHEMLYQVTQRHNFLPEAFTPQYDVHWAQHPLRPEFTESTYMLYKATNDPHYLEVGEKVITALQDHARVHCGFAGIKDVRTGSHEDRMDSFVLAETFKYLYLLFAEPEDLVLDVDNYLLTTEAHILPLSISKVKMDTGSSSNATKGRGENATTTVTVERSCANHKYLFPGGRSYAQALREPVKKTKNVQSAQCPSTQQPKVVLRSDAPRLKAAEFVPGNPGHMQQLTQMGIRLITMKDGRVQLMHTASNAKSTDAAEQGALFMQEMIELSKSQQAEISDSRPRVVQVMAPDSLKNMVLAAGPAQFGMDLNENFAAVGELIKADPFTACNDITNGHEMAGKIIMVSRGDCMFIEKARRLEKLGAHGGIVVDNVAETSSDTAAMFAMSGDGTDDVNIPMVFLFSKEGNILLDALSDHGAVEVLLLEKAKTLSELNEIWGHFHSSGTDHAVLKFKASVDSVQVTSHDAPPDDEQTGEGGVQFDLYDEDGDEEYECPAPKRRPTQPVDVMDYHTSSQNEGMIKTEKELAQQVTEYFKEITKFANTKSDIDMVLAHAKEILEGAEMESARLAIENIMKEFEALNEEAEQILMEGGDQNVLRTSADPTQLQSVFDALLKEYLETEEGRQYRSDNAESALKHKMNAYDNFPQHISASIALDGETKDAMKEIVDEFIEFEKVRLQFDKLNPLHEINKNEDIPQSDSSVSKSNQDMVRTTSIDSSDHIGSEDTPVAIDNSEITSSNDNDEVDVLESDSDSDESHIPQEPPPAGDSQQSKSAFSKVVEPQMKQRLELVKQRHQQLLQQMATNKKRAQEAKKDSQTNSEQNAKEEL